MLSLAAALFGWLAKIINIKTNAAHNVFVFMFILLS